MHERGIFVDFPLLKRYLIGLTLLLSCNMVSGYCNSPDSLMTKFARLDHSDYGYDYYYLKLSMFPNQSGRAFFYDEARRIELNLEDKNDFLNDSALFSIRRQDREQLLKKINDLYKKAASAADKPAEPERIISDSPLGSALVCESAQVACSENIYSFAAGTTGTAPPSVNNYPNYGCLGTEPCPAWFYMQVGIAGDIIISIQQTNNHDVDFICWGPFSSLTAGCDTGLTGTCSAPTYPTCCNNNLPTCANFYPRGNITDCSYSPSASETCHILNAQVDDIYILLITNFSTLPGMITFSQTGGTGWTNCYIVYHCSMIAITANTTTCNGVTNTYSVSGNIEFSNPPPTGTLTITDITAVPQVSQTLLPPFTSPMAYNLTNIPCDGVVHTLSAVFSDSLACNMTKQYTAPLENCPQAQISGGGEICNDGTSTADITVSFSGTGPFDFTYAINGIPQTPVTGYNGPFPYVTGTSIPGTYTLVSLSNAACPGTGTVSGTAVVIVDPLPVPSITGANSVCSGLAGNKYVTEPGMHDYLWTASPGGLITAGGGINADSIVVTWNSPGVQTIGINYTDTNGCQAPAPVLFNVNVKPIPMITNADSITVCSGTTINIIPTANVLGTFYTWTASGSSINVTGFLPGLGNSINDHLVNTGFNVETVSYTVTPQASGCSGNPDRFAVAVIPVADVYFVPASQTICSGLGPNIQILSHATGATFVWTAGGSSGNVSGYTAGNGIVIQQPLVNTGFNVETVTYVVTPVVSGCSGTSNEVTITVDPAPLVTLTSCWDPKTTTNAKPFKLKGGIPLGGTFSGAGISSGIFTPAIAGPGLRTINYSYTNTYGCTRVATQTITVIPSPAFVCGNTLNDIRDNKTYPTILIGSQCWMAANLDYGTMIPGSLNQRDNCIPEKYCYNDLAANCNLQETYYQWDEVMQFDDVSGSQGFCPPGWHMPSQTEWDILFSYFVSIGFAGDQLKITGFSGFNAILSGTRHLDKTWDYQGFATFFWTSTSHGSVKAWAHGMNDPDPSVSVYPAVRSDGFNVRCIKD